jgi:hypothetical protein
MARRLRAMATPAARGHRVRVATTGGRGRLAARPSLSGLRVPRCRGRRPGAQAVPGDSGAQKLADPPWPPALLNALVFLIFLVVRVGAPATSASRPFDGTLRPTTIRARRRRRRILTCRGPDARDTSSSPASIRRGLRRLRRTVWLARRACCSGRGRRIPGAPRRRPGARAGAAGRRGRAAQGPPRFDQVVILADWARSAREPAIVDQWRRTLGAAAVAVIVSADRRARRRRGLDLPVDDFLESPATPPTSPGRSDHLPLPGRPPGRPAAAELSWCGRSSTSGVQPGRPRPVGGAGRQPAHGADPHQVSR